MERQADIIHAHAAAAMLGIAIHRGEEEQLPAGEGKGGVRGKI
ncbi:hypothetical protein E2C01_090170 [Portunus trituberculatus]|uniref:Uncharacterized protein n=1 Tax=Portunus trituberculatus TaxID=210409 RepID=A0A5B7JPF9_PORTR|nr:hypothetical protein [Portunus trituberculatus]